MKAEDILKGCNPDQKHLVEEYLDQFADPIEDEHGLKCHACGDYYAGLLGVANFTTPGEGTCYACGHPFRYNHDIPAVGRLEGIPLMYKKRIQLVQG